MPFGALLTRTWLWLGLDCVPGNGSQRGQMGKPRLFEDLDGWPGPYIFGKPQTSLNEVMEVHLSFRCLGISLMPSRSREEPDADDGERLDECVSQDGESACGVPGQILFQASCERPLTVG